MNDALRLLMTRLQPVLDSSSALRRLDVSEIIEATVQVMPSRNSWSLRVEVLFLDISMPKTNGMQLVEVSQAEESSPDCACHRIASEYALDARR